MKFSFSKDAQDQKMKVVNSPGLKISVQVYATDQAGNQSSASTEITVTKCTPSLVCNDLVKFDIQAGEALSIDVDNFLEGPIVRIIFSTSVIRLEITQGLSLRLMKLYHVHFNIRFWILIPEIVAGET